MISSEISVFVRKISNYKISKITKYQTTSGNHIPVIPSVDNVNANGIISLCKNERHLINLV